MTSFYPQPASKTYDLGVSEVVAHFETCGADCNHLRELQNKFGVVTVSFAIDQYAYRSNQ